MKLGASRNLTYSTVLVAQYMALVLLDFFAELTNWQFWVAAFVITGLSYSSWPYLISLYTMSTLFSTHIVLSDSGGPTFRLWYVATILVALKLLTEARPPRRKPNRAAIFFSLVLVFGVAVTLTSFHFAPIQDLDRFLGSLTTLVLSALGGLVVSLWVLRASPSERREAEGLFVLLPILVFLQWVWMVFSGVAASRIEEPLGKPNTLALVFVVGIVVAVLRQRTQLAILFSVLVPLSIGLVLVGSRSSVIAVALFLVLVIVLSLLQRNTDWKAGIVALVVIAVSYSLMPLLSLLNRLLLRDLGIAVGGERFGLQRKSFSLDRLGANPRLEVWQESLEIFIKHPFTGVGVRHSNLHLEALSHPHSVWLGVLAETGILGTVAVVAILGFLVAILLHPTLRISPALRLVSTVPLFAHLSFISNWDFQYLWIVLGFVVGICTVDYLPRGHFDPKQRFAKRPRPR